MLTLVNTNTIIKESEITSQQIDTSQLDICRLQRSMFKSPNELFTHRACWQKTVKSANGKKYKSAKYRISYLSLTHQYDCHKQTRNHTNQSTAKKTCSLYTVSNTTLHVS